jgi:hypothetical protein
MSLPVYGWYHDKRINYIHGLAIDNEMTSFVGRMTYKYNIPAKKNGYKYFSAIRTADWYIVEAFRDILTHSEFDPPEYFCINK